MGKNKLSRFAELETFGHVYQPSFREASEGVHPYRGRWSREAFGNDQPLVLELGCGKGEYTVGLARNHPGINYIGLDIKGARIWKGAKTALDEGLSNAAFLRTHIDFIRSFFAPGEVDALWITFPDPQTKRRRRKKRLTGPLFLNAYREILKDRGRIHLKTDNRGLYRYTLDLVRFNDLPLERHTDDLYGTGWTDETVGIRTYYEERFLAEGARIHFLEFLLPSGREVKELPYEPAADEQGQG